MKLSTQNVAAFVPPAPSSLVDSYGRQITYLRLAITDRCNLRCRYCMPESGVTFMSHDEILSFEELERLVRIFAELGVSKVRLTGGEPFARQGCVDLLGRLRVIDGIDNLHVTTNGVATHDHLADLKDLGLAGINLSLDTLEARRFWQITRRDSFERVKATLHRILALEIPLKINSVVQEDTSDEELSTLVVLASRYPITVRFIELMPFSGDNSQQHCVEKRLRDRLLKLFPVMSEIDSALPSTARLYSLPKSKGKIGVIEGYSRRFCGQCNKVRITPQGVLKNCLYDDGVLDLRDMLRQGVNDLQIKQAISSSVLQKAANGHETEKAAARSCEPSMASIGG